MLRIALVVAFAACLIAPAFAQQAEIGAELRMSAIGSK
jgi:hypothetical protein